MKYLIIILLISSSLYSQNSPSIDTINRPTGIVLKPNPCLLNQKTTFEKILYTELAVVGFALTDVIIYPMVANTKYIDSYRMIQGALQLAISYILLKEVGLSSAIGFNVQLLFSTNDLLYYGFYPSEFNGEFNHLGLNPIYIMNGNRISKNDIKWGVGFSIYTSILLNQL